MNSPQKFPISRRQAIFGVALGTITLTLGSACANKNSPDLSVGSSLYQLRESYFRAQTDSAIAEASSAGRPESARMTSTIATERRAHADALKAELIREKLTDPQLISQNASTIHDPVSTLAMRERLRESAQLAQKTAYTESGYRCGLLASIAAAVTTQAEVVLA